MRVTDQISSFLTPNPVEFLLLLRDWYDVVMLCSDAGVCQRSGVVEVKAVIGFLSTPRPMLY